MIIQRNRLKSLQRLLKYQILEYFKPQCPIKKEKEKQMFKQSILHL